MRRFLKFVIVTSFVISAGCASAFESRTVNLPVFAQHPFSIHEDEALKGKFYSGVEPFGLSMHGGFGRAFGAPPRQTAYSGYYRAFRNKSFTDIRVRSGYAPALLSGGTARGYDFTTVDLKAGYNLGRFQPFLIARVGAANSRAFRGVGFAPGDNGYQALFGGPRASASFVQVGAGFNFAVSPNVSLGFSVSAGAVNQSSSLGP